MKTLCFSLTNIFSVRSSNKYKFNNEIDKQTPIAYAAETFVKLVSSICYFIFFSACHRKIYLILNFRCFFFFNYILQVLSWNKLWWSARIFFIGRCEGLRSYSWCRTIWKICQVHLLCYSFTQFQFIYNIMFLKCSLNFHSFLDDFSLFL